MEFKEVTLTAFGPFTDRTLAFDQADGPFHIVHGANEAGKSSALRGLKALLYGIDERTSDNFVHANENLRIAGCLRAKDGHELAFVRRKGRKNTLLDADGQPLDETILTPFLQGVSEQLFEMLFGIDHRALVQGGQEILAQQGDVGQALFSASLGSHALHTVLADLDREADELFRPRGSTTPVNAAIKSHADLNREIKACSLSSRQWDEHRRKLARTSHELEQVQAQLTDSRSEVNRLQRIKRCLPRLAQREELQRRIEASSDVIVLPDDFGERRRQTIVELDNAQSTIRKTTSRVKEHEAELDGLEVRQAVLDDGENIEALHAQLGGHRKALQDRPHLKAEHKQLMADRGNILKDVRPDLDPAALETLRPVLTKRARISALGTPHPELVSRAKGAAKSLRETENRLQEARQELEHLPATDPPDALRRAIAAARKTGDVDSSIQSAQTERDALKARCETDLARLTLWTGSLKALSCLSTPSQETISQFEDKYLDLDQRAERLAEKQSETTQASRDTARRLDEIQRAGAVPSEQDLAEFRGEREQVWQLVRRQWIDGEDVTAEASAIDAEHALPEAFEVRVTGTDELADRLRREADRVHTQASLLATQKDVTQRATEIAQQLEQCAADRKQLDDEWQTLWRPCDVQPRTPREMRAWLEKLEKLIEQAERLHGLKQQVTELVQTRDTHMLSIAEQVQDLDETACGTASLEAVLLESEEVAAEHERIRRQRVTLDEKIDNLEREAESGRAEQQAAGNELDAWKTQWTAAVEDLGLTGDALPAEATDMIEKLKDLFAKQNEAGKLQIRIQAIDADAKSFQGQATTLVARVAPELDALSIDEAVTRLNALLSENQNRLARRQQIETQLKQARQDNQEAEDTIKTMTERLDELCTEAHCSSHAELEEAERKSVEHRQMKKKLAGLEQSILDEGEGAALEELAQEAQDNDPDALPAQIQALTNTINDELEPRRTMLAETKGGLNKELELMDGSDRAAALADHDQLVLAGIRSNSERYVRLKLAARILREEIERYREENQGPLIKRASEHFATLTLGSFDQLHTDFNDKDEPILVGVRPNRERVHIEGMSAGTRDQLYLALRLASLEKYMESTEPMPFIVDDILVDFDDERSEAALTALAGLARKTQVVLFTHHSRVVQQARGLSHRPAQVHAL